MRYYDVLNPDRCTGEGFDALLSLGWYPMGQSIFTTSHLFRENDITPPRVYWLRYPVMSINERVSHRRIRSKNRNFETELVDPFFHSSELDSLYDKYLESVDFDGYASISKATYSEDELNIFDSKAIISREGNRIVSCGIFHEGTTSIASVLHFYDPEYRRFSPGKYLILKTLDYCKLQKKEWYYPGYVVEGEPKMDYKLFLGQESAQYYNPEPHPLYGSWQSFYQELLTPAIPEADNTIC